MSDLDAIVVATTPEWLAPVSQAALESGKHVLCEKPIARSAKEAQQVVECAARNGAKLKAGFNLRHHPALSHAHKLVQQGRIGRLMFIRCRYGHGGRAGYEREWRADPARSGGGELLDQGIHVLDLIRWFLGDISDVFAAVSQAFWPIAVEDNAFCTLRTPTGQIASLHVSWTQWRNLFSFEIFGEEGYLIAEGLGGSYGPERLVVGRRLREFGVPEEEVISYAGEDCSWREEWNEFVSAIQDDRPPLADGYDGLQALRLVDASYQSAQEGRRIILR